MLLCFFVSSIAFNKLTFKIRCKRESTTKKLFAKKSTMNNINSFKIFFCLFLPVFFPKVVTLQFIVFCVYVQMIFQNIPIMVTGLSNQNFLSVNHILCGISCSIFGHFPFLYCVKIGPLIAVVVCRIHM